MTSNQKRRKSLQAIKLFRNFLFENRKRLDRNLTIRLSFQNCEDAYGICDPHDVNKRPREFTIIINRNLIDEKLIISTVAHEMVHVWQYATGKLRNYESPVYKYEDEFYHADMRYRDMPWEIEARKLEKVLYRLWINNKYMKRLEK
jgi:hypothetical protein